MSKRRSDFADYSGAVKAGFLGGLGLSSSKDLSKYLIFTWLQRNHVYFASNAL